MEVTFSDIVYLWLLVALPLLIILHFYSLKYLHNRAIKFANFDAITKIKGAELFSRNITLLYLDIFIISNSNLEEQVVEMGRKSFDQKIDVFKQKIESSIAAKEKNEVTLTVTAEEINSKTIELLAQGDLPLKEALINFDNNLYLKIIKIIVNCLRIFPPSSLYF